MLAVQAVRFGGPRVLVAGPVPDPEPGPGQVVVRTAAADVLFVDTAIRAGHATDFFPIRPPYVPGNGIAGRVIAAGDGVDPGWLGRAVVVHTGGAGGSGGYAEQVAVPAGELIPVPDGLGLPEAAALLHDGSTAAGLLELTGGQRVDVVFDGAGGELGATSFGLIARGGRFSAHGMSDGGFARLDPAAAGRLGVTVTGIGEYAPAVFRRRAAAARGTGPGNPV